MRNGPYPPLIRLLVCSLLLCCSGTAFAQRDSLAGFAFTEPLSARYALDEAVLRLDDTACILQIGDILADPAVRQRFKGGSIRIRNKTGYCGWLQFSIRNDTKQTLHYMLGIPGFDSTVLFEAAAPDKPQRLMAGPIPYRVKFIAGASHVLPLILEPGERKTYYLRVRTDNLWWETWFRLTLESEHAFRFSWYFYGFYLGTLLLLIFTSFGLSITYRDGHYLVLSLPLIGMLLWFGDVNGDLHLLLDTPQSLRKYAYPFFTSVFLPVSVVLFPAYYTRLRTRLPWAFRALHGFVLVIIGFTIVAILRGRMMPQLNPVLMLMYVYLFSVIGWIAYRGDREARSYFIFGMPFFLTGFYWLASNSYDLRSPVANLIPMQIGSLLSSLIIGHELYKRVRCTMMDRIRVIRENKRLVEEQNVELEQKVGLRTRQLAAEKEKSERILLNILPAEVAAELKEKGSADARLFEHVTVLFTDFVNFTGAGEHLSPQELVDELHECFKSFDGIITRHGLEKIKTIGDAYLAVAGLPNPDPDHPCKAIDAALEIRQFMLERRQMKGADTFEIRLGIHSGPVVAGIVGLKKFAYDIWGDTVNTAARMEQHSEAGRINISQATYELIGDGFRCCYRGEIAAKNKGAMKMYFVDGRNEPAVATIRAGSAAERDVV